MEFLESVARTALLYIVILVIFRLMGKREIGELSVLDLVVFIMIGEMAVMAIEDMNTPIWKQVVPMASLMAIQVGLAFVSLKSKRISRLLDGHAVILVDNGKIKEQEMRKQRYNFDDLLTQMREQGVADIRDVAYAILEPSGKLSVFQQTAKSSQAQDPQFSLPLILDGVIQSEHLEMMGKTNLWLRQSLRKLGYQHVKQISYCSFQNGEFFVDLEDK
ncbi:DUF421 domain-containing protein [Ectobacillus ponti]|uniref:DUF421 domain-containing protein n=1 Tax=Ectobacillus ponti TaxID=2961894 RepID=A0AA41X8E0_9BACI|nr:DUF421 domain-containing protein [Ectobacillus ponti]MCP8967291.1 DUF421 domain-containing protein [Ectobacillus ponti]